MAEYILSKGGTVVKYTGSEKIAVLPEGIIGVGEMAFTESDVEEVVLPKTARKIDKSAFRFVKICSELRSPTASSI